MPNSESGSLFSVQLTSCVIHLFLPYILETTPPPFTRTRMSTPSKRSFPRSRIGSWTCITKVQHKTVSFTNRWANLDSIIVTCAEIILRFLGQKCVLSTELFDWVHHAV